MTTWTFFLDELQRVRRDAFRAAHTSPVLVQIVNDPGLWQSSPGLVASGSPRTSSIVGGSGGLDPFVFELSASPPKERVVVGRSRTADVMVPLSRLSKQHVWFGWSALERSHFVSDMGSKNGTYVNGDRLSANFATQIENGAEILLGPYPFRFYTPEGFLELLQQEVGALDGENETRDVSLSARTEIIQPSSAANTGSAFPDVATKETKSKRSIEVPQEIFQKSPEGKTSDSGFEVLRRLGQGGMADVVLARRQGPGGFAKEMAIKRLLPEFANDRTFLDMFVQEARLAARLNHPNVVQIYELGTEEGRYFIAMEYVVGWDLSTIIKRTRRLGRSIPIEVALRIGADLCAGLHAAHTCMDEDGRLLEIVHRDISPHNVLVSVVGISKITDFGISKAADSVRRTRPGELKGKLAYMAPEQVDDGLGEVDPRTDIFAAGLSIYEMLTLEAPFRRGSELLIIDAVLKTQIPDVREKRPDVPEAIAEALKKALARSKDDRYASIYELQRELERAGQSLAEPASATRCNEWLKEMSVDRVGDDGLPDPRHRTKSSSGSKT